MTVWVCVLSVVILSVIDRSIVTSYRTDQMYGVTSHIICDVTDTGSYAVCAREGRGKLF